MKFNKIKWGNVMDDTHDVICEYLMLFWIFPNKKETVYEVQNQRHIFGLPLYNVKTIKRSYEKLMKRKEYYFRISGPTVIVPSDKKMTPEEAERELKRLEELYDDLGLGSKYDVETAIVAIVVVSAIVLTWLLTR